MSERAREQASGVRCKRRARVERRANVHDLRNLRTTPPHHDISQSSRLPRALEVILRRRASTRRRAPRTSDDSPPARPRERPRSVLAPVTIQRASSRARPLPVLAASTPRASSSLDEDARPQKRWAVADRRPLFFPPVSPRLARAFHLERDARTALKSDDLERARERCPAACAGREDRALDARSTEIL